MSISIVIPTYNRLPILAKCLYALEQQGFQAPYEVVVVDDGSTDETLAWLQQQADQLPHVTWLQQDHGGPAAARNLGVRQARYPFILFIDSDLVVTPTFLQAHWEAWHRAQERLGGDRLFTYGRVVNTANFEDPTATAYKLTDYSAAYFATGNVMIAKHWLEKAGLFDTQFSLYGWEDLELGVRLKQLGLQLVKAQQAVGYHWHPAFNTAQLPSLIDQEFQRGKMGALFYQKHPTWDVRMMVQMTGLHWCLWGGLSLGGRLNERTLQPLMDWLIQQGYPGLAYQVARIFLNWYSLQGLNKTQTQSDH
ncbi:MAG: glycosyltransferase family A protein [Thermosynechococcaceae cyanobacterium]